MTRGQLVEAMQEADVLVPTLTDNIDAGLLGQAGDRLRLIANYGSGVDHIDVADCPTARHSCLKHARCPDRWTLPI